MSIKTAIRLSWSLMMMMLTDITTPTSTITMPSLKGVNFSGASVSKIRGFESEEDLDFYLSGASISQLDANYREVDLVVSGASSLVFFGSGDQFHAEISGASTIQGIRLSGKRSHD